MKYTGKKSKKHSILERCNNIKLKIKESKHDISKIKEKLEDTKKYDATNYDYRIKLEQKLEEEEANLGRLRFKLNKLQRIIRNRIIAFGAALTIASGSLAISAINNGIEQRFEENLIESNEILEKQDTPSLDQIASNLLYEQLKSDIKTFSEIKNKETINKTDEKTLENIKDRIKASPEAITKLALDTTKQKIADVLGIEDYTQIIIQDNTTQLDANNSYHVAGTKVDVKIFANGKKIASRELFETSNGVYSLTSDNIPKKVLNNIYKIVDAQKDSTNSSKAIKALKSSLKLDEEKDIIFESTKSDEER